MAILGSFWKRFVGLLPKSARYVGTVVSVISPGRYAVQLSGGGGIVQATAGVDEYVVSDRVFVTNQKIDGSAPTLPSITIDV